jgi:hypothetical protein
MIRKEEKTLELATIVIQIQEPKTEQQQSIGAANSGALHQFQVC